MAHVGFVLICYGATDAVASVTCGSIVRAVGRVPLLLLATALNLALIVTMLIWKPDASEPVALFVMAALWGLADAVWQTQVNCNLHFHHRGHFPLNNLLIIISYQHLFVVIKLCRLIRCANKEKRRNSATTGAN